MPDDPAPVSLSERLKALESRLEPTDVSEAPKTPPKSAPTAKKTPATKAADKAPTEPAAKKSAPAAKKAAPVTKKAEPAPKKPATKAPATKAAATKAAATKAAATKAPAKKAPAKKSTTAVATAAVVETAEPPTPSAAAPTGRISAAAAGSTVSAEPPVQLFDSLADPDQGARPVAETRGTPGIYRVLMVLTVVLLAGALGLFAAAIVESGQETWSSTISVQLVPGTAPSVNEAEALAAGQKLYVAKVPSITSESAVVAGVPQADVREDLAGAAQGSDQIQITSATAAAGQAERMAAASANVMVATIASDQARTVSSEGDRLRAVPGSSASSAERTKPSDTLAAVSGALVAGGVLLFALTLWLIRRSAND